MVDALMHGLPVASESNVFPVIPDTDSFLLVPKSNDDGGNKAGYHHSLMLKDHGGRNSTITADDVTLTNNDETGHRAIRRFSTGDVTVPYTNVEILSQYLAAASKGSYHDYSKYGVRNEEDGNVDSSSAMKMFNDTFLGKEHHDVLWNTAATLMERRKKKMSSSSTVGSSIIDSPKFPASNGEEFVSASLAKKGGGTLRKDNGHSPSRSEIGIATSPKHYKHVSSSGLIRRDNVSPFTRSTNPSLLKTGTPSSSSTSQLGVDSHKSSQNSRRRSVSVSKARISSSVSKLDISSTSNSLKPKKSETLVSPVQRRSGISMSKLAPSSASVKDLERSPTHHLLQRRSMLPKEDRKVRSLSVGRSIAQNRTEQKSLGAGKLVEHNKSTVSSSPAKHKFLRRQTISEHVGSSTKRPTTRLSNGGKGVDTKSLSRLKDIEHNNHVKHKNHVKQVEADDEKEVVKPKITAEKYLPLVSSSSSKHEPHKVTQSSSQASTMKVLKRTKYVQGYGNLRRIRARSAKSEPMGVRSNDMYSVNSSTGSCETDLNVLEQNVMERILESRSSTTAISTSRRTSTRSGALSSTGDHKEKQPRKLKVRPGRVIEFKYEITSPRRLKFKRTSPPKRHDNTSSLAKVDIKFEVLRNAERRQESGGIELQEVDANEQAGPSRQDIDEQNISKETTSEMIIEDRKIKVKALVGAFESLICVQDSNTVPTVSE